MRICASDIVYLICAAQERKHVAKRIAELEEVSQHDVRSLK